jgi:hypothetical protein
MKRGLSEFSCFCFASLSLERPARGAPILKRKKTANQAVFSKRDSGSATGEPTIRLHFFATRCGYFQKMPLTSGNPDGQTGLFGTKSGSKRWLSFWLLVFHGHLSCLVA